MPKKIIKFITMASHLGFERQIPNFIVLVLRLYYYHTLAEDLKLVSKTVVHVHIPRTDVKQFLSLYCKIRTGLNQKILHFVKNWLVGTIRIIYLC